MSVAVNITTQELGLVVDGNDARQMVRYSTTGGYKPDRQYLHILRKRVLLHFLCLYSGTLITSPPRDQLK